MGKIKELQMEEDTKGSHFDDTLAEFEELQRTLLKHKYLYYVKYSPIVSDYDYDMMENQSLIMAKLLGFRADKWEGPDDNEKDHVHWMVDFDYNHRLSKDVMKEVDGE